MEEHIANYLIDNGGHDVERKCRCFGNSDSAVKSVFESDFVDEICLFFLRRQRSINFPLRSMLLFMMLSEEFRAKSGASST